MKITQNNPGPNRILRYRRHYADNFIKIGIDHYTRCSYRCHYCITESQGQTRPVASSVDELMCVFQQEIASFTSDAHMFCLSIATDPYNELEAGLGHTRAVLDWLTAHDRRISMTTKSGGVLRDIDLLKRMSPDRCKVLVSLTASSQDRSSLIEPFAPTAAERLDTIHKLHAAGIQVCAGISPWIPGITDTAAIFDALPPDCQTFVQPLLVGTDYEEPFDRQRAHYSAWLSFGRKMNQDEINRAYIEECNTVGKRYWRKRPVEWRMPVTEQTHHDNSGYLKRLKPGMLQPGEWPPDASTTPAETMDVISTAVWGKSP